MILLEEETIAEYDKEGRITKVGGKHFQGERPNII